jgi:hypothetical protein
MMFQKERERFSVLYTGYQVMFEKERQRHSVLHTGYQMIFEKEREIFQTSPGNQYTKPKISLSFSNII